MSRSVRMSSGRAALVLGCPERQPKHSWPFRLLWIIMQLGVSGTLVPVT